MDERDVKAHEESAIKTANEGLSFKERYSGVVWNHMIKQFRLWNKGEADKALEVLEELYSQGETEGLSLLMLDIDMNWQFARRVPEGGKVIFVDKGKYEDCYEPYISYGYWNKTYVTSGTKKLEEFGTLENLVKEFLNDNF